MAIAPGLTIGLVRPPGEASTACTVLKGSPVAFTPTTCRTRPSPTSSQTSARTNGLATLMMVNRVNASPAVKVWPEVPMTATPNSAGSTSARAG